MKLKNLNILITGASTGIGSELSRQLAVRGCRLILIARREELLQQLCEEIGTTMRQHQYYVCDVADEKEVQLVCRKIIDSGVSLDVLILNAGVGGGFKARDIDIENFHRQFDVNFWGAVYFLQHLLPAMLKRRKGIVAVTSSLASYRGMPNSAPYSASKAALDRLLESLRVDLWRSGLQFTLISPGFVETPMTAKNKFPMPFMISVQKAVRIIIRGLERGRTKIRFPIPMVILSIIGCWLPDTWWAFLMHNRKKN
ncbi:SDR family NAD(P)-dependent oxidoreductase [candidate division KSB1 bacterium]|nr:SDR family NAD(P)-dependent oxidoreductase [candidate division KSB1 bacterium]